MRTEVITRQHDIDLPIRRTQDPLQIYQVEFPDPPEYRLDNFLVQHKVRKDIFRTSQIHRGFQLRYAIESITHKDHHTVLLQNGITLLLDNSVVKHVRIRPVTIGLDFFRSSHEARRWIHDLIVTLRLIG